MKNADCLQAAWLVFYVSCFEIYAGVRYTINILEHLRCFETVAVPGGVETRYSCCEGVMGAPGCQVFKVGNETESEEFP